MAVTTDRSESATDRPSWSRPPFEIDNVVALRHGADSSRSWKPIADRLEAEMVTARPWLLRHLGTVRALARVDAQIELIGDWLDANGLLDRDGNPRPASARLDRLEARAQSLRNDLGEPPAALIRLLVAGRSLTGTDSDGQMPLALSPTRDGDSRRTSSGWLSG
jgi:hypothetical protein